MGVAAAILGSVACASVIGLDGYAIDNRATDGGEPDAQGDASASDAASTILSVEGITLTPVGLTINDGTCDVAKSGSFTLTNTNDVPTAFEITLAASDTFTLDGATNGVLTGTLASKEARVLTIEGKSSTPEVRGTDLLVKVGATTVTYGVKLLVRGARLAISPAKLDFGDIKSNTTSTATVLFKNEGTDAVTITGFGDAGADFKVPAPLTIPAGGETPADVTMTSAPAGAPVGVTVTPALDAPVCGAIPSLEIAGHRVDQETLVNPVTLDFGNQNCGAPPATALKVTLSNYRTSGPATFTTNLPAGTFKVAPTSGSVPAATGTTPGKVELAVTLSNTNGPPGDRNENLTVNMTGSSVVSTQVKLHVKTSGALVQLGQSSVTLPLHKVPVSAPITNVGNVTVCVAYDETSINDRFFGVEADRGDTLEPNVPGDIDVAYDEKGGYPGPPTSGPLPRTAPVTIQAVSCGNNLPIPPLCGPIPTLTLIGAQ